MHNPSCVPDIARRSVLGGLAAGAVAASLPGETRAAIVNLVVVGGDGWLFPVWDEVRHVNTKSIQQVADVVNEATGIFHAAGIDIVIALTPVKSRIYREYLPNDFKFSADPERRYAIALEALRRPGTLVPDLATLLAAQHAARPAEPLYFKADTHWTAAGAEAAATEIARQIREKFHLPASAQPGTRLGPLVGMVQEKNDLADLLPPADAEKYPLVSYRIHQVEGASGGAELVADDTADVAVVGNSYMQPRLGFAPMLSNQLNRPVGLEWKVHQVGPYRTMLNYLSSDGFRRHRPKLIVWNFHETDMTLPADRRDGWGSNVMPPQVFLAELRKAVGG